DELRGRGVAAVVGVLVLRRHLEHRAVDHGDLLLAERSGELPGIAAAEDDRPELGGLGEGDGVGDVARVVGGEEDRALAAEVGRHRLEPRVRRRRGRADLLRGVADLEVALRLLEERLELLAAWPRLRALPALGR